MTPPWPPQHDSSTTNTAPSGATAMPSGVAKTLGAPGTGETIVWLPSAGFTAIPALSPAAGGIDDEDRDPDGPLTRASPVGLWRLPSEEMTLCPNGSDEQDGLLGVSAVTTRSPGCR